MLDQKKKEIAQLETRVAELEVALMKLRITQESQSDATFRLLSVCLDVDKKEEELLLETFEKYKRSCLATYLAMLDETQFPPGLWARIISDLMPRTKSRNRKDER